MPRRLRVASGGYVYRVLRRGVSRARIFRKTRDYEGLEEAMRERLVLPRNWQRRIDTARNRDRVDGIAAVGRACVAHRLTRIPGKSRPRSVFQFQSTLHPRGRPWKNPTAQPS